MLPEKIDGKLVTEIGAKAFELKNELTGDVTIPSGVRKIGTKAFTAHSLNGSLILPEGLEVIDAYAFAYDGDDADTATIDGILYSSVVGVGMGLRSCPGGRTKPAVLSDNLEDIASQAFRNCRSIGTKLVLPASIQEIGMEAFARSSLTELVFTSRNAPVFEEHAMDGFHGTAYYPPTWSELELPANSENVTWVCRCTGEHTMVHHEAKAPTCTDPGWEAYDGCSLCDYAEGYREIPALGHSWNQTVYEWSPNQSACTAMRVCKRNPSHIETNEGIVTEKDGMLTAVFPVDWAERQTVKKLDASQKFKDVPRNSWYFDGVEYVFRSGLFLGTSDNTFEPETPMDRAMLVTVLWRYAGRPDGAAHSFPDVPPRPDMSWCEDPVSWAAYNGIVLGYPDGTFGPLKSISRQDLTTILYRFTEGYLGEIATVLADLSVFPDADKVFDYAEEPLAWAVEEGLLSGRAIGGKVYLDPRGNATRAQVATIMMRFAERFGPVNK